MSAHQTSRVTGSEPPDNRTGKYARHRRRLGGKRRRLLVESLESRTLLAGDTLFLAGCRDVIPKDDPTAAYEGRGGPLLLAVAAADGKRIAEYELDAPPVNDGMSAAQGRLYISSTDGTVTCLVGRDN